MIKKRSRPATVTRERELTLEPEEPAAAPENEEEVGLDISDLLELRKLKRAREGIDAAKLRQGDAKKRRIDPATAAVVTQGGLREVARDAVDEELEGDEAKARRTVRSNNFTGQTNALDVDKHMMNYIEENMRKRYGGAGDDDDDDEGGKKDEPWDPLAELFRVDPIFPSKAPTNKPAQSKAAGVVKKKNNEEGSVTNSATMLTAIPEVDLGMDTRLKNIQDTEKAKRTAAELKQERMRVDKDDIVAGRFYRGQDKSKLKTDEERLRSAMAAEMSNGPDSARRHEHRAQRKEVATDDIAMERFKKRMANRK